MLVMNLRNYKNNLERFSNEQKNQSVSKRSSLPTTCPSSRCSSRRRRRASLPPPRRSRRRPCSRPPSRRRGWS